MPRIRSLKPEHKQHRKVGPLSDRDYRLWVGMITEADDDGRLVADAAQLRVLIFGYHPQVGVEKIEAGVILLAGLGLIRLYAVDGVRYADFPSWTDHQRINRPSESKLPPYNDSVSVHGSISESALSAHSGAEGSGEERRGRERKASAPTRTPNPNGQPPLRPFKVPPALDRTVILGADRRLRSGDWWRAEVRANSGVDFAAEILKAEAWLVANPKRPRKDLSRFLHNWLARAERREPEEDDADGVVEVPGA